MIQPCVAMVDARSALSTASRIPWQPHGRRPGCRNRLEFVERVVQDVGHHSTRTSDRPGNHIGGGAQEFIMTEASSDARVVLLEVLWPPRCTLPVRRSPGW